MYNKVVLVGNLTRDIELGYSPSGIAIAKTAIATSRKFTSNGEKKEEVCFIDIIFFGKSGEVANQYLRKGSKILVDGRLNFEQWVANNGQTRSKHTVIVETMKMLGSKNDTQQSNNGEANYQQPQQQAQQEQPQVEYQNVNGQQISQQQHKQNPIKEIDIDEDEIPF